MQVKDLMKRPYIVDKDVTLQEAAKLMSEKGIGSLIFVQKGKAKGIVTESDLLRNFGKQKNISEVMCTNIISTSPEETVEDALKTMKQNKIKRLPVVDDKKNLVGIISMTDIATNSDKLEGDFLFN